MQHPTPPQNTNSADSQVKDVIDAQSGRFEFLKQTLTLGAAGLAGIAALFTDPTRIPTDLYSRIAVAIAGLSLISIVAFATMGLSAYANALTTLAREKGLMAPSQRKKSDIQSSTFYIDGIVDHAQWVTVTLFLAWFSILAFAGLKFFYSQEVVRPSTLGGSGTIVKVESFQKLDDLINEMQKIRETTALTHGEVRYLRENNVIMEKQLEMFSLNLANLIEDVGDITIEIQEIRKESLFIRGAIDKRGGNVEVELKSILNHQNDSIAQTLVALRDASAEIREFKLELSRLQIGLTKTSDQLARENRWK